MKMKLGDPLPIPLKYHRSPPFWGAPTTFAG
jgi:hypothetical protein